MGLDKESIKSNAAKRGLAKLCLNSMWGKLTKRNDRTQTKVISEPKVLYRFLATPGIEVTNLTFASDDVVWVLWKYAAEERVPILRHTNQVIEAYVTTGAKIHLYRYLDRLQVEAIYCDTDSVIYIQPTDEPGFNETGDKLGDMTSELRPTDYISEFEWRVKELCVQGDRYRDRSDEHSLRIQGHNSELRFATGEFRSLHGQDSWDGLE